MSRLNIYIIDPNTHPTLTPSTDRLTDVAEYTGSHTRKDTGYNTSEH